MKDKENFEYIITKKKGINCSSEYYKRYHTRDDVFIVSKVVPATKFLWWNVEERYEPIFTTLELEWAEEYIKDLKGTSDECLAIEQAKATPEEFIGRY